ncbi:intermembrane transport protein PqiB [Paracoccus fistulariae]|uniref:MCE family protein n=1 Tax=Paracoccus fistulariae TaxID=658446 RepID=A0ABY7SHG5_9RHOB|nr:MlaD family protein [Paracoccus fistulariae]MDB6180955.1 MlaD family protein [Paracoccus fistulariae]WCR06251.1 MCE family protein [Paracoccus fistulariae]
MSNESAQDPQPLKPASPVRKTAKRAAQAGLGIIWLVPILALVVTLGIGLNAYSNRGPLIEVEFADATGVIPGETVLRFREITVGQVETVSFSSDLSRVIVKIRVEKDVAEYIDSDAAFWIVRPEVTARGVTRLDTVLSGSFIEGYWDAEVTEPQKNFVGLNRPPLIREDAKGTWVTLAMDSADGVTEGSPILYRGIQVGRLENVRLSPNEDTVITDAFIEAPHDGRLTTSTVFWNSSGFSVSLGLRGVSLNVSSLSSLLTGGVAFDTLVSGGQTIEPGYTFYVQPDEETARNDVFAGSPGDVLQLTMYVDDSLEGLEKGADVEFQGLNVGQVSSLSVVIRNSDDPDGEPEVKQQVVLAVSSGRLGLEPGATRDDALRFLEQAVQGGLRARVASAGLLGLSLKVELVEIPDAAPASLDLAGDPNPVIPSVEGNLEDFTATAEGVLNRIGNLPIEDVLKSATDMMDSVTAIASSQDTRAIPGSLRATLDQAQAAVTDINGMAQELRDKNAAAKAALLLEGAVLAVESIRLAAVDTPALIERIDSVATSLDEFGFAEVGEQAQGILSDIRAMLGTEDAEQLPRNLSDTLEAASGLLNDLRDGNAAGSLNNALDSASTAADEIARAVQDLPQLIQRLQATAVRADAVLASYGDRSAFNNEAIGMLREIRRATSAFGSLARMIERNPQAFILGR